MTTAKVLLLLSLSTCTLACAGMEARRDTAIDATLRQKAPKSGRNRLGHVHVGDFAIMQLRQYDQSYEGEGGPVGVTLNGVGRAVNQERTKLDLEHSPTHVAWASDCTSRYERVGIKELDGLIGDQSTTHRLQCRVSGPDATGWSFESERVTPANLEGVFSKTDGGTSWVASVELDNQGQGVRVPTVHLRENGRVVAASVLISPERMWIDPDLSMPDAGAAAAFMLSLRYVDYTSKEDREAEEDERDGKPRKGVLDLVTAR